MGEKMSWIEEASRKRKSQYSTVIVLETSDIIRLRSFITMLKEAEAKKTFGFEETMKILIYDPWEGLTGGDGSKIKVEEQMPFGGLDVVSVLQYADVHLKEKKVSTVFIVKNITDRNPTLINALRSWAVQSQIYENGSAIFIFVDQADKVLDDYTKSLVAIVRIPLSSAEERKSVAEKVAKDITEVFGVPKKSLRVDMQLIDAMAGLNLHDCESALLESFFKHKRFDVGYISEFKAGIVKKSGILEIMQPRFGFEAVGGYEGTKEFITKEIINVLKDSERARKMGIRPPRGVLFFGPPGTGKSLLAKTLAYELKLPFIELRLENIMRSLVGETEQRIRSAIDLIEEVAPAIVFMDEMDRLGHRTDTSLDSGVTRRLFSTLLEWLGDDRRKAIVVGTTNEPDFLDAAMLRAGRLDRKIPLMFPDVEARKQIFIVHTSVQRKVPLASDVKFEGLANETKYYSGAEIEELVLRAARKAFNEGASEVSMRHFREALNSFNIDLQERNKTLERYVGLAEKYTDDKDFLKSVKEKTQEIEETTRVRAMAKAVATEKGKEEMPHIA